MSQTITRLSDVLDTDLWTLGNTELVEQIPYAIAVTGSRASTTYGDQVAADIATWLTADAVTVLNSAGFGIDSAALRAVLATGGKPIVVQASGIDCPTPAAHRPLLDHIVKSGGLIVSLEEPGSQPTRTRFERRNQWISKITAGVVIVEANRAYLRGVELIAGKADYQLTFDLDHLRSIHRHLFQDVYEWAGQLRVTELVRPATDANLPGNEFVKPEHLEAMATQHVFPQAKPSILRSLDRDDQVDQLARTYAALNVLHPFVEGNGRTSRLFLQDLAGTAGLAIDWRAMPHQNDVMKEAFSVGYQPVADALRPCVIDHGDRGAFEAARLSSLSHSARSRTQAGVREHGVQVPGAPRRSPAAPRRDPDLGR